MREEEIERRKKKWLGGAIGEEWKGGNKEVKERIRR